MFYLRAKVSEFYQIYYMANILVFGAGKSSSYLIKYLLANAPKYFWQVIVADANLQAAQERVKNHAYGKAHQIDILNDNERQRLIQAAQIVLSLLPPSLHYVVAKDCLRYSKNLITASYVSPEIRAMDADVKRAGLVFMNEIGLDPGIDHMSAMKIIDEIERLGGDIYSFKSYCGGLVANISDTNPWHYKISWNPRNILLAGKSGAHFLESGFEKTINYQDLFKNYEKVQVPNFGELAAYANRDSLSYKEIYKLDKVKTMLRATFRYESFCIGWNTVIQLGLINENDSHNAPQITYHDWFLSVTQSIKGNSIEEKILHASNGDKQAFDLLNWLGLYAVEAIGAKMPMSSADILLQRIEEKWKMEEHDKDLVVMHHEFGYMRKLIDTKITSSLIVEGEDKTFTAMAKTVGLPMAMFTRLQLTGKVNNLFGVQIPISAEVYKPILKELAQHGIDFHEAYLS